MRLLRSSGFARPLLLVALIAAATGAPAAAQASESPAAPAAPAAAPQDAPADFGVIQFAPTEAWIDLPQTLGETWRATLAVLAELKYAVKPEAAYLETNGRIEVEDLWVSVEPHGSRGQTFTRVRIALDASDAATDEYTQVRAEVILDAIATRLQPAPAADPEQKLNYPYPAQADPSTQPAPLPPDPAYQDVYTGPAYADAPAYAGGAQPTVVNNYDYSTSYYGGGGYSTPYYGGFSYYSPYIYAPYGCYSPYGYNWSGYYGGYGWASGPSYASWYPYAPSYCFGYGSSWWWGLSFSASYGSFCASIGVPWYGGFGYYGGCYGVPYGGYYGGYYGGGSCGVPYAGYYGGYSGYGPDVVVVVNDSSNGDDNSGGGSSGPNGGAGNNLKPIAVSPTAGNLSPVATVSDPVSVTPVDDIPFSGAGSRSRDVADARDDSRGLPADGDRIPGADRSGDLPRIHITERPRQAAEPRFDPRTVVTRQVDTRRDNDAESPRTSSGASVPRVNGTTSTSTTVRLPLTLTTSSPRSGTVVRLNSPPYSPSFKGVIGRGTVTTAPPPSGINPYATSGSVTSAPAASGPVTVRTSAPSPVSVSPPAVAPPVISSAPVYRNNPAPTNYGTRTTSPGVPSFQTAPAAPRSAPQPASVPSFSSPSPSAPAPSFGGSFGGGGGASGGGKGAGGGPAAGGSKGGGRGRP